MTDRDSLGYRCCDPPVWMRITDQRSRGCGGGTARELDADTLLETIEYVLVGHNVREAGEHFGLTAEAVKHRMCTAGYGYNAADGVWTPI